MDEDEKKKSSQSAKTESHIVIDKTASLWNQLRLAWADFHIAKNNKKPESETKRFEILISNLLNELGIHNIPPDIFQLIIPLDKIPEIRKGDQIEAS
jgi:hypothetical protein